jgi:hypothetical protein
MNQNTKERNDRMSDTHDKEEIQLDAHERHEIRCICAASAMSGMLSGGRDFPGNLKDCAKDAVKAADYLLKALGL